MTKVLGPISQSAARAVASRPVDPVHNEPVTDPSPSTPRRRASWTTWSSSATARSGNRAGFGGATTSSSSACLRTSPPRRRAPAGSELVDPEGLPLARVTVEQTFDADGLTGLVGPVETLTHAQFGAFRRLYLSPAQVRERHGADTLTVPVAGPLTTADLDAISSAAGDRTVVLLALVGHGTPSYEGRRLSSTGLLRATLAAAEAIPGVGRRRRASRLARPGRCRGGPPSR